jgi:hypothetical protein
MILSVLFDAITQAPQPGNVLTNNLEQISVVGLLIGAIGYLYRKSEKNEAAALLRETESKNRIEKNEVKIEQLETKMNDYLSKDRVEMITCINHNSEIISDVKLLMEKIINTIKLPQ